MVVCPDCRVEMADPRAVCSGCGWIPGLGDGFLDYLSSADRKSAETAELIETYDILAERDWAALNSKSEDVAQSPVYVKNLNRRFALHIGDVKGKKICDIGSDRGFFATQALALGAKVTAVDITEISLRYLARIPGISCFRANAENLPFRDEFDVLVATDILNLLPNMANLLVTANWSLRDGAVFAVRVPNRERLLGYSNFLGLPVHFTQLRTFDRTLIVDLVEEAGFAVERVFYDGYQPGGAALWLKRYPRLRKRVQNWLAARYGQDDASAAPLRRLLMKPYEIGVIARKTESIMPTEGHRIFAAFAREWRQKHRDAP